MSSRVILALSTAGFDPSVSWRFITNLPRFVKTARAYAAAAEDDRFRLKMGSLRPILSDFRGPAGRASGDYFHQDLWAARKIFRARPASHLDVGSRIDGFIGHLLTFMTVDVIDIRPLKPAVAGLRFVQADATGLGGIASRSVESLSSLHAIEHFGLGRYGDPIDPQAWYKASRALARVLKPRGRLYFSVPIGQERLEFNSKRVFSPRTILATFSDLKLLSFAAVDGEGMLHDPACPEDFLDARHACGLFEFTGP
jgi:SAM-dependent methyltransferase